MLWKQSPPGKAGGTLDSMRRLKACDRSAFLQLAHENDRVVNAVLGEEFPLIGTQSCAMRALSAPSATTILGPAPAETG